YGRVEPDVKVLPRRIGNLETEVGRIARDVPVLQPLREPFAELACDALLNRAALDPGREARFEGAQPEEIVLRIPPHGRSAAHDGYRIAQVGRRVGGAAVLAGVAV